MALRSESSTCPKITCGVRGCRRTTSKKKPYCPAHVARLPYAKAVARATPPRFSKPSIDGCLRLLDRLGLVLVPATRTLKSA